ncbi:hypothetical protein ACFWN1_19640 [Streptomyces sp. NPDC058459]|uniref:hypothetical protein n=1 Tax=Streptomyces sp. NPDC058459 TaxID=3346508 RepID=UPI0036560C3E
MIVRSGRTAPLFTSALLTRGLTAALRGRAPGGRARWERKNHAGRTVDLYTGPATAATTALAAALGNRRAGLLVHAAAVIAAVAYGERVTARTRAL